MSPSPLDFNHTSSMKTATLFSPLIVYANWISNILITKQKRKGELYAPYSSPFLAKIRSLPFTERILLFKSNTVKFIILVLILAFSIYSTNI